MRSGKRKGPEVPESAGRSDGELLDEDRRSDSSVYFGELYSRYMPMVYGVCLKYLGNADDAADAVMSLFEDLAERIGRYEIDNFRTWIYAVAKNHCFQLLRRRRREIPLDDSSRIMEYAPLVHLLSEREDEALVEVLNRCMEKLPDRQRECILEFFYADKSYADIAAQTLYPIKSVKSYLQNAKRNLKLCMEKAEI